MEFDHPHIVRMLDAGRTEAEGADLIYAVCEYPDEFVATVLADRPLTPAETREALNALLPALGFLHEKGLAHGAVDTSHITAFGDTIKLTSDTIRQEGAGVSAAEDMWSFGATLHEMLTQQPADVEGGTDFGHLPEPFATIVRNTLKHDPSGRWGVGDVERHLNPPPRVVAPEIPVAASVDPVAPADRQDVRRVVEAPKILVTERPAKTSAPPPKVPVERTAVSESMPFEVGSRSRRPPTPDRGFPMKWVPIAGLVAALAVSVIIFRKPAHEPPPAPVVEKTQPAQTADRVVAPPPRVEPPASVAPNPSAIWRVVAYTYNSRGAAEKKARSINEKRAPWRAEVFTPRGERPPYYVALGGRMTLAQAQRLQKDALSKGLPRDTFVRNFAN